MCYGRRNLKHNCCVLHVMKMTSFGHKKYIISTNKRRAGRPKIVECKPFFMTKKPHFQNTTNVLQISTSNLVCVSWDELKEI